MSENTTNKDVKNDEIDLLDLFRRMGKTLTQLGKSLGRAFLISIVFLLKRWFPLGLSIVAGIIVSFALKNTSTSSYSSDLVFRNNLAILDKKTLRDHSGTTAEMLGTINKLQIFCSENNMIALSESMSMKPEMVKNISDISAYWIIDQGKDGIPDYVDYKGSHNVYDTVNVRMHDRLDIRVRTNSSQNLNLIRDGLIRYIGSDSLYQEMNKVRLRQNRDLLARMNYDIQQLDSLQKVKYFEETRNIRPASGGQIVFMQEQKTQLLHNDILNIYEKKQILESERDLYKGIVTVLSDFSSPTRRENGSIYYGKQIIPFFFVITLLLLIILANRKKFKDVYRKYQ